MLQGLIIWAALPGILPDPPEKDLHVPILTHEERIGTTLNEKYRLDGLLGRGGMGAVFAATHLWTGRPVAVKMLNPEYASNPDMAQRFLREARTAAGLKHPNVVDVLDMGSDVEAVYIVLERLDGTTLGELIDACGAQPPSLCASVLIPVMQALSYAHGRGVVHRDLKPDNVFIADGPAGGFIPKLVDFGIAKVLDAADRSSTQSGAIIGTPQYMSPEQTTGAADLGPQADVWSMGIVWYECLSGKLPFDGSNPPAIILAVVTGNHVPLGTLRPDLPAALCEAIEGALQLDRGNRYPDMRSFTDAVVAACESAQIERTQQVDLSGVPRARPLSAPDVSSSHPALSSLTPSPRSDRVTHPTLDDRETSTAWSKVPTLGPRRQRNVVVGGAMGLALAVAAFGAMRASKHPPAPQSVPPPAPNAARASSIPLPPSEPALAPSVPPRSVELPAPPVVAPAPPVPVASVATDGASPDSDLEGPAHHHHGQGHRARGGAHTTSHGATTEPTLPSVRRNNDPVTSYE